MLGLRHFFNYGAIVLFIALNASCADNPDSNEGDGDVIEVGADDQAIEDQVHYQVPTPAEMMDFVKASGGDFKKEYLCTPEIYNRYVDLKGKSMGMGIYIADLAYTASFSQFQESIKYFNVIVKMAEEVGVSNVFDDAMLNRIKNNLDNTDSLAVISDQSYYKIIAELEANDRGKIVAMVAAGGFLESLFITTQLVTKFDKDDPLMERIASQKLVYMNIMAYLDQYKEDQNVEWTISDMSSLNQIFMEISDNRRDTKFSEGKGGKKVLGGVGGVYITEQEFEDLRYQVSFLRNAITFNSEETK
jgi:hypothetical protein